MDGNLHRKIVIFSLILLKVSFVCCFSFSSNCSTTYTTNGVLNFNSSDYNETTISFCIVGPIESRISLVLLARDVFVDESSTLAIYEISGNFTDLLNVTSGTNITEDIYANSFTNGVAITFSTYEEVSKRDSWFRITFQIETQKNTTTIYTDPSGFIVSDGSYDKGINYIHSFLINVKQGNRIYLFLSDLLLNDQTGDFLIIGSGNSVLSGSPAVLLTGARKKYKNVIIENNRAYLHLYAKDYTKPWHFSFYYNTSLFVPPTDEPPTTEAPPIPLNATIKYDVGKENFTAVVIKFAQVIQQYATSYCRGEFFRNGTVSNVTLNVTVAEAAIADPCLVLVFYILLSGSDTCVGHRPFLVQDFQYMMDNYGMQMEDLFGRTIMSSCGMDVTVWVVVVAIIGCISLALTIIMAMTSRKDIYNKLVKPKGDSYNSSFVKRDELSKNEAFENKSRLTKPRDASYDNVAFEKGEPLDNEAYDRSLNSHFTLRAKKSFGNDIASDEETHYEKRPAIMRLKSLESEDEIFTTRKVSKREESVTASDKSTASSSSSSNYPSSEYSAQRSAMCSTEIENHVYYEVNNEPVFTFENTLEDTKL